MNYIVDAKQMQEIDRRTIEEIGIPSLVLMEKAAEAVAAAVCDMVVAARDMAGAWRQDFATRPLSDMSGTEPFSDAGRRKKVRILAVCGTGGNGGDAIAAARILHFRGYQVVIWLAGEESCMADSALQELRIARKCKVPFLNETGTEPDFRAYDILVDGLFGVGLSRNITGRYREIIEKMNASEARIVAVDIPSGIHAGTGECMGICIQAERTVTFGERKIGQLLYPGAAACGKLTVADIGFPPFLTREVVQGGNEGRNKGEGKGENQGTESRNICCITYGKEDISRLPARSARSNKGTYGKVLVIAGSKEVTGAAYLAARAAYQSGVGLVKLLSVSDCIHTVRQLLPEVLTGILPEAGKVTCLAGCPADYQEEKAGCLADCIRAEVSWADSILAGPGIGLGQQAEQMLSCLFKEASRQQKPLLLDADALNLLSRRKEELSSLLAPGTVLTPHLKELSRLTGLETGWISGHLIDTAKQCTYNNELVYVIKDARTITAYKDEFCINTSGCDGMATGGSGDVLAGIIAGLMVAMKPEEAARLGVYLHGLSGEKAAARCGHRGMLAGDILEEFHY